MLIAYATGSDLDNIVALYGVERLRGEKPRANVDFNLSSELSVSVTIPAGTLFRSDRGDISMLLYGVTIPAHTAPEVVTQGILELDEYVKTSEVKTEYIQTPLPFVVDAKQSTSYEGGADPEADEAFRERAILSLERFSTAGSEQAYKYWSLSASAKVEEVSVSKNHEAGDVMLYLRTSDNSDIADEVKGKLTGEKVRPLTDKVVVNMATRTTMSVSATIELLDMSRQTEIDKKIRDTRRRFSLGEDVNLSYLYKTLHQDGVYRATITNPPANKITADSEFVEITAWNLTFTQAVW
jgi:phage-related baseplate assembly protein